MEEDIGVNLCRKKVRDLHFNFSNLGGDREGDDREVEIGQRDLKAFAVEEKSHLHRIMMSLSLILQYDRFRME